MMRPLSKAAKVHGMKLALVTHAEHPKLRGTLPEIWPEFMSHDPVVQSFWPQLYDQYPDFQIWVVDREVGRRATVGYACSVPVGWNGDPSPRGIDWALTDGVEGTPTALCAIVRPERDRGGWFAFVTTNKTVNRFQ